MVNLEDLRAFMNNELKNYPHEILNVYLFGSRLWGYAKPDTDWDFIVVVKGEYYAGDRLQFAFRY